MSTPKRQRQKEARARKAAELAKARKRAELLRTIRTWAIMVAIVLVFGYVFFIRGDSTPPTTTTSTTTTVALDQPSAELLAFAAQETACGGTAQAFAPRQEYDTFEYQDIENKVLAVITTSCGDITIELDPTLAPESVNNFVFLAREDFFDGMVFHRVVADFIIQTGDPLASGVGGPGYSMLDEIPEGFVYGKGTVALARGNEVSASQFFIVIGDRAGLDPIYNPLGKVIDGWDVIDSIASVAVEPNPINGQSDRPTQTIYIQDITIIDE